MRLHPRARSSLRRASRVGDTNGVLSFPHCFVTNDVVESNEYRTADRFVAPKSAARALYLR